MKRRERKTFEYRARDKAAVQKRANQSGGLFDSPFKPEFSLWKPKEGDNRIRFLPPTWDSPEHFGLDVYVHYGIGSDSQAYLCLEKMRDESCPCCEERKRADKAGDSDYARELMPTKRVLVWVMDRDDEASGPQLWSMAWTIDRDLAALSVDKRTGETLFLDSPEDGYDVDFTRTGSGLKTKYSAIRVARKPSPLADDEEQVEGWLKFVQDNPLPDVLQYFDAERIAAVAAGKAKATEADGEDEEEEDDRPTKRGRERASMAGTRKTSRSDDDDEDNDEDEDEDEAVPRKPAKAKRRAEPGDEDDDDEDEDEPPKKAGKARRRGPEPVDDEDEDED